MKCYLIVLTLSQCIALISTSWFGSLYESVKCSVGECCNNEYVRPDWGALNNKLRQQLFGQHIAVDRIIPALKSHFHVSPKKALVISMHGWTGGGKTHTTHIVADSLYKYKRESRFVHYLNGRLHFPLESKVDEYIVNLQNWIRGNVSECDRSMFIFDEVQRMPLGLIDGIKPYFDYHEKLDNVDYRKSVFVFISNIGGNAITARYNELWKGGIPRELMTYSDFEPILRDTLYNTKGGFKSSAVIEDHLISLFVPFLPLEKEHVRRCIILNLDEQQLWRSGGKSNDELVEHVLNEMEFYKDMFSITGCKRVHERVSVLRYAKVEL